VERAVALALDSDVVKVSHTAVPGGSRVHAFNEVAWLRLALDKHRQVELWQR
jgi:hypothetical protein